MAHQLHAKFGGADVIILLENGVILPVDVVLFQDALDLRRVANQNGAGHMGLLGVDDGIEHVLVVSPDDGHGVLSLQA